MTSTSPSSHDPARDRVILPALVAESQRISDRNGGEFVVSTASVPRNNSLTLKSFSESIAGEFSAATAFVMGAPIRARVITPPDTQPSITVEWDDSRGCLAQVTLLGVSLDSLLAALAPEMAARLAAVPALAASVREHMETVEEIESCDCQRLALDAYEAACRG